VNAYHADFAVGACVFATWRLTSERRVATTGGVGTLTLLAS